MEDKMNQKLCLNPKCECDIDVWREVFDEEHHCPELEEEQDAITK